MAAMTGAAGCGRSTVFMPPMIFMLLLMAWLPVVGHAQAETVTLLTAADYSRFATAEPDHRFAYGDDSQQFAELYLPATAPPHPLILLIHGGCYREAYDLRPISALARSLTRQGLAVWNIEYRRAGNGGDFPAMFLDVGAAADFLREIAADYALKLDDIIAMGHSAGGHLALWLAARGRLEADDSLFVEDPLPIAGLIGLAAIAHIADALEQGMCGQALPTVVGHQGAGSPADSPSDLRQISPERLLPLGVAQIHLLGSQDKLIGGNLKRYIEAAESAGDDIELVRLDGAGHFELVAVDRPEWQAALDAITRMRSAIETNQQSS